MFYEPAFLQILKRKEISMDCVLLEPINWKFYVQNFPAIYNFGLLAVDCAMTGTVRGVSNSLQFN